MLYSAIACVFAARHRNAAVVILQPVPITPSAGTHAMAYHFNINKLGASTKRQPGVATLANGITIGFELRLDLALC